MTSIPQVGDIWFRAMVPKGSSSAVHYEEWHVTKVTPKGIWVSRRWNQCLPVGRESHHRWFSFDTRFVQSTKEAALQRLIRRTAFWVKKERARLRMAEDRYKMLTGKDVPEAPFLQLYRSR